MLTLRIGATTLGIDASDHLSWTAMALGGGRFCVRREDETRVDLSYRIGIVPRVRAFLEPMQGEGGGDLMRYLATTWSKPALKEELLQRAHGWMGGAAR